MSIRKETVETVLIEVEKNGKGHASHFEKNLLILRGFFAFGRGFRFLSDLLKCGTIAGFSGLRGLELNPGTELAYYGKTHQE